MARRPALLALLPLALTCAVAAHRPSVSPTLAHHAQYDYDSLDPFAVWDDYNPYETSPAPSLEADKPNAKVILRGHIPKTNVSTINSKGEDKNKVIKTSIKIESYTNIIVTKSPQVINRIKVVAGTKFPHQPTRVPVAQGWEEELDQKPSSTTKRSTARRSTTPRRAATTVRPTKTTRRATVPTVPYRRPAPYHRPTPSRRPAHKPRTTTKKPKPLKNKKPCSQKNVGWVSSFFQENDLEKSPKNEVKSGIFSSICKWLWGRSSWFSGVWLDDTQSIHSSTTSTTAVPLTTSTDNWFQAMLHSEENDDSLPSQSVKKPPKKSLKKNYKGFQLLRAYPDVQWKVQEMLDLQEEGQGSGLMWWTSPSLNGSTDLLVPPDLLEDVRAHLKSNKIEFDVIIYDLQKAIAYENPRLSKKQRIELELLRGHPMTWRRYHRYADILRYLEYLQHSNSEIVELVPLGRSSEGLPLVAVKVSLPSNETQVKELGRKSQKRWRLKSFMKPAVWLEGGAHAREWIAPAVATWMLHALVEGEKGLGPDYELLKMADFYILPVLNPDGYEHSHTHDRLWMKTRSRFEDRSDDYYVGWFPWNWGRTECVGVDTDRNWDYRWGEMDSSRDPCADNYAGPHPFSEPETRAVSEFLAEHRRQIKVYLSFHAYTQTWLTPSTEALTSYGDDGIMLEMGKLATAALADMYGSKYQVGTAAEIRQPASGMSHDWAKARAGIKFSYHVDLRDSVGRHGFLLPGSQIVPTARETWQAVKAIVDNLTPG